MARKKTEDPVATTTVDVNENVAPSPAPRMGDPGWDDYILSLLVPVKEKDGENRPKCIGLRRVVETLGHTLVGVTFRGIEAPTRPDTPTATVECHVTIAWDGNLDDRREFGGVSDCGTYNTPFPYVAHPSSTAATKAESQAYKRALRLNTYTAEEMQSLPQSQAGVSGFASDVQVRAIDKLCRDINRPDGIDVLKFVNSGQKQYNSIHDVTEDTAAKMLEKLNSLFAEPQKVPDELKGYKAGWRNGS